MVFTSRTDLYDTSRGSLRRQSRNRSRFEGDNHGLGLATIRKHRLAAQMLVVLLTQLTHNVLLWARQWLSEAAPRLHDYGIIQLIRQV